jgi:nucleotide-binding universal stress UspA family protein
VLVDFFVNAKNNTMKPMILAPIDFSAVSLNAANYAAALAHEIDGNLTLLNTVQMPVLYGEIPMPIGNYENVADEAHEQMRNLVLKMSREYNDTLYIHYEVKSGSPVYEIAEWAEKHHPLMIVLGTRGLGSIERFLLGSVTLSLSKESPVPVLVIPEHYTYRKVHKIGFATDLQDVVSATPDELIKKITSLLGAELHVIHNDAHYHELEPAYMEEGMLLDTMFSKEKPDFHFTHNEMTEEGIIDFSKENNLDWLMVMPKKHGFFDELFGHQHTREFVLHAELPIMILPLAH